jgi:hypothetical protein
VLDAHFLDVTRRDGREGANHFKWLANVFGSRSRSSASGCALFTTSSAERACGATEISYDTSTAVRFRSPS